MAGRSYNHVVLVGRLGADPQYRSTSSGKSVCNFNLATNRRDKEETTDWHKIELWENLADVANKFLRKGSQVLIEGRIANENYEKNGVKHYSYKIVATNLLMLESRKGDDNFSDSPAVSGNPKAHADNFDNAENSYNQGSYDPEDNQDKNFAKGSYNINDSVEKEDLPF